MSDLRYWIALSMLPEVGSVGAGKLLSVFRTPEKIFAAGMKDLLAVEGIGASRAKSITRFSLWGAVEKQIKVIEREGIHAVHIGDSSYPVMLKEICDPPVVVYVKGDIRPQDRYDIAVVGSRNLTHYGEALAANISEDRACMGFTIVSGMARGVDSISHRSAIKAGGRTIAYSVQGSMFPIRLKTGCS